MPSRSLPVAHDEPAQARPSSSRTRASFRPSRSPSIWLPAWRSVRRSRPFAAWSSASGSRAGSAAAFQGTSQAFQASLSRTMPFLILAALSAVYIVLGILYESYRPPAHHLVDAAVGEGVGAVLALCAASARICTRNRPDRRSLLLIGIVKKNGDHDDRLRASPPSGTRARAPRSRSFEACVLRFRPILMTTMAALLGALPLVISSGPGAELRRPLGITIVGGLSAESAPDAVHDAGRLPLSRPLPALQVERQRAGASSRASSSSRRRSREPAEHCSLSSP